MSVNPEQTSSGTESKQDSPSIEESRGILSRIWQFLTPGEKRKIQKQESEIQEAKRSAHQELAALHEQTGPVPDGEQGEEGRESADGIASQETSSSDPSTDIPLDPKETTQTTQTDVTPELPENKTDNIPEQPATIQPRISEEHVSQEGKLNNVGSITVNDMFDEGNRPSKLTLQIPKGTGSAKQKVGEDTPHEVHWDEKQGSYVFSSGPFEGKRPLIKDGMILTPSTGSAVEGAGMSPSGGKEVVSDVTEVDRPQTDVTPELPENKTDNIPEQPATIQPRISEEHVSQEGKLNNVGSITVNDMFDEGNRPSKLTLQIPKGTGSAKQKVGEDTPHEVHWDEKQGSYVFSSGPFEGKRPLIKDGMILTPSTGSAVEGAGMSPSGGKEVVSDVTEVDRPKSEEESQNALLGDVQLRSAETNNAKFFDSQPEIKGFVMENLPKYMGYKGEMDNKQLSSLIAQFQKDNNLPVDGYITGINSPTGKFLLQALAEKKVVETWKSGDIGGNNYLPDGTKFVAPISEKDIKKLTESGKTDEEIKQIIADASQHCAPFVTYMNGAIRGNAWTMPGRILDENGKEIANTLRGLDWGDLSIKPQTDEIQGRIRQAIKDNPIPTDQIEVGDVITMMHPGSKYQERAMVEGLSDKKGHGIVSTHIGQVTEANGKLFVTHNIHGTISTEPLEKILAGTGSQGDIATGVFRLNSKKNIVATVQRTVARATNALGRKEPDARSE